MLVLNMWTHFSILAKCPPKFKTLLFAGDQSQLTTAAGQLSLALCSALTCSS